MSAIGSQLAIFNRDFTALQSAGDLPGTTTPQKGLEQISTAIGKLKPEDFSQLTASEAGDFLALIAKLESRGVTNLAGIKAVLSPLVNQQSEAPKAKAAPSSPLIPTLPVTSKETAGTVPTGVAGLSIMGSLDDLEESKTQKAAETSIAALLNGETGEATFNSLLSFAHESFLEAKMDNQLAGKAEFGSSDIKILAGGYCREIFATMSDDNIKTIMDHITNPEKREKILAFMYGDTYFGKAIPGIMGMKANNHVARFQAVFSAINNELINQATRRGLLTPELEQRMILPNEFKQTPETKAFLKECKQMLIEDVNKELSSTCEQFIDSQLGQQSVYDLYQGFGVILEGLPVGITHGLGFEKLNKLFSHHFKLKMADLPSAKLDLIISSLQKGAQLELIDSIGKNKEGSFDAVHALFLQKILTFAKEEKQVRLAEAQKADQLYGLDSMDYTLPSYSAAKNFFRSLGNFFKAIFTFGIANRYALSEETLLAKVKDFGLNNGRLLWQISMTGVDRQEIIAHIKDNLLRHNQDLNGLNPQKLATRICDQLMAAKEEWIAENFGDVNQLSPDDFRVEIGQKSVAELGERFGMDLSKMDGVSAVRLKAALLTEATALAKANNGAPVTAEQMATFTKSQISHAAQILDNVALGNIPAEPAHLDTIQDSAASLISQICHGFEDGQKLLVTCHDINQQIQARFIAEFEQRRAADPNAQRVGDGDDLSRARSFVFQSVLTNLTDNQLRTLAQELTHDQLGQLSAGTAIINAERADGQPAEIALSEQSNSIEGLITALKDCLKAEADDRHLDFGIPLEINGPRSTEQISRSNLAAIKEFSDSLLEANKTDFALRAKGMLSSIAQVGSGAQLAQLFEDMRASTHIGVGSQYEFDTFSRFFEGTIGQEIKSLSGHDLLEVFKGLQSPVFLQHKLSLVNAFDAHINEPNVKNSAVALQISCLTTLEAMVNVEITERASHDANSKEDISGANVQIMAGAVKRTNQSRLAIQSDDYLHGTTGEEALLTPEEQQILDAQEITLEQFNEVMQNSDLTINISASLIYGDDPSLGADAIKAVFMKDGQLQTDQAAVKNIFATGTNKGPHYLERRLFVEHEMAPELKNMDKEGVNPENHPVSAALNIGQGIIGGATTYSNSVYCALILKDEVKKRTTFSPADSFDSFEQVVTKERLAECPVALQKLQQGDPISLTPESTAKLTPEYITSLVERLTALTIEADPPRNHFGLGHEEDIIDLIGNEVRNDITNAGDMMIISTILMEIFAKGGIQDAVTTADKLQKLLPKLNERQISTIKERSQHKEAINCEANYIEGQIYGGVDITRDVKELRICDESLQVGSDRYKTLLSFAEQLGVPLHIVNLKQVNSRSALKDVTTIAQPAEVKAKDQTLAAFKEDFLAIMDLYKEREGSFDPLSTHGRAYICRSIIYAEALMNYLEEQGLTVDHFGLLRAVALHDAGRAAPGANIFEANSRDLIKELLTGGIVKSGAADGTGAVSINGQAIADGAYVDSIANLAVSNVPSNSVETIVMNAVRNLPSISERGRTSFSRNSLDFGTSNLRQNGVTMEMDPAQSEALIGEALELAKLSPLAAEHEALITAKTAKKDKKEKEAQVKKATEQLQARNATISNEDYLQFFIDSIRQNPDQFPFLNKYFH